MASEIIKLNLIPKGEMPVFHCSQFDNGRLITIELYRGEDAYEVPAGYTVELHCRKVDNNIVTLASTLVNTNVVTFTSTTQLTACNGKNLCEVAIKAADDYLIGSLNFWLDVEVDPLKGGINSTSEIHDLYEQIEDITAEVIGDDYYDKTEVDNLLDAKADKSTTYTKTQVDTLLTSKADKSNVYTKSETNTLLSAKADADNVYTKAQVETKLAAKADAAAVYTKDETDTLLDAKANANAVYSKVEVDAMVDDLEDAIDLKADAATTYTKTEIDTALALKANAADVYTKAETDAAIEAAIDDILPVDTAGPSAIANFTTALASPLVDCKVGIVATGGNGTHDNPNPINGYTEANVTRCGVNLFDGAWFDDGAWNKSTNLIKVSEGASYYANTPNIPNNEVLFAYYYDENKNRISDTKNVLGRNAVFTIPTGVAYIQLILWNTFDYTNLSINYPATDTTYHPYNGQTYTIAFGQTVYGGVLDVTRGKLKPCIEYPSYNGETLSGRWLSSEATYVEGTTPPTGSQVVSLDDYGTDIDLTPVQMRALVGENNIYGDTNGNTTVKFKDTIQNYIDKKVNT